MAQLLVVRPHSRAMIIKLLIRFAVLILVILAACGFLVFLAFKCPDFVLYLLAAAIIGSAGMLVFYLKRAVMCGELPQRFPFGTILRHKSPIAFWIGIGAHGVFAGFWFFLGLALLGLAPHWYIALLRSMGSHH